MTSIHWRDLFLGMLIAAIVVNAVEFPATESHAAVNWKALHRWERSDVLELNAVRRDYGFYVRLAEIAPQAILIVAPKDEWSAPYHHQFRHSLFGIARVSEMQIAQFHPQRDAPTEISGDIVVEDIFGKNGATYKIVASEHGGDTFVLFTPDEKSLLVVDLTLLPHQQIEALSR